MHQLRMRPVGPRLVCGWLYSSVELHMGQCVCACVDALPSLKKKEYLSREGCCHIKPEFCSALLYEDGLLVLVLNYWQKSTRSLPPKKTQKKTNQLPGFVLRGTRLTIRMDKTTQSAWRQRGVRERQGGRVLLSRLKAERGCQQASNALLSLQRGKNTKWRQPDPPSLQWIRQEPEINAEECFSHSPRS